MAVFAPTSTIANILASAKAATADQQANATSSDSANASAVAIALLDTLVGSGNGSGSGFLMPPGIPALEGRTSVDTMNVYYPKSLRPAVRNDTPAGANNYFASGVTSIELRDGKEVIEVRDLETPVLFASRMTLPPNIDLNTSCGVDQDACEAQLLAIRDDGKRIQSRCI